MNTIPFKNLKRLFLNEFEDLILSLKSNFLHRCSDGNLKIYSKRREILDFQKQSNIYENKYDFDSELSFHISHLVKMKSSFYESFFSFSFNFLKNSSSLEQMKKDTEIKVSFSDNTENYTQTLKFCELKNFLVDFLFVVDILVNKNSIFDHFPCSSRKQLINTFNQCLFEFKRKQFLSIVEILKNSQSFSETLSLKTKLVSKRKHVNQLKKQQKKSLKIEKSFTTPKIKENNEKIRQLEKQIAELKQENLDIKNKALHVSNLSNCQHDLNVLKEDFERNLENFFYENKKTLSYPDVSAFFFNKIFKLY